MTEAPAGLLGEGWLENAAGTLAGVAVESAADGTAQFVVSAVPRRGLVAFVVDVRAGRLRVSPGRHKGADVVLKFHFDDFCAVWTQDLSPEAAYMTGRVKVDGNRVLLIDGWRPLRDSPDLRSAMAILRAELEN